MTGACVLGCAGPALTAEERAFFADVQPWGFILFRRNIESPDQVRALTEALRATVGRRDAPMLIDQEGGRVQRLAPPHWRRLPPALWYSQLAGEAAARLAMARLGARLIAHDLAEVGVNVDCAPVLDAPVAGAHDVIGDRAYGEDPALIATFGRAVAEGLIAGGVLPVMKHAPGHGRARADSHADLPVVETDRVALSTRDFAPFRALADLPMAMTAHVVYAAIDAHRPATLSPVVIDEVVRQDIGFDGLLITDDLSMRALHGDFSQRARDARAAGCDIVLHCNGDMAEMRGVVAGAGELDGLSAERAARALARLPAVAEAFDAREAGARLDAAFRDRWAA